MKLLLSSFLFAFILQAQTYTAPGPGAVARTLTSKLSDVISVDDYGAVDNGNTDNTSTLNAIFIWASANHPGATIYFPCTGTGTYQVTGQINFQSNLTYEGNGGNLGNCKIYSVVSGGESAFNFVGINNVDVKGLDLASFNTSDPPKTVVNLGRDGAGDPAAHMDFFRVKVEGYATQALVYSVASEEDRWWDPLFILNGGGANYVFYTSDSDQLAICSCPSASNTDVRFYGLHFYDYSPTPSSGHSAVYIGGESTGDWMFNGGYISTPGDGGNTAYGTAFTIHPSATNTLSGNITVEDVRVENGIYFVQFAGAQINSVHFIDNTLDTYPGTPIAFAYSTTGTVINQSTFKGNLILPQTRTIGHSFYSLVNSSIDEYFHTSVSNGAGNLINQGGTLSLPGLKSLSGTRYVCVNTSGQLISSSTACSGK